MPDTAPEPTRGPDDNDRRYTPEETQQFVEGWMVRTLIIAFVLIVVSSFGFTWFFKLLSALMFVVSGLLFNAAARGYKEMGMPAARLFSRPEDKLYALRLTSVVLIIFGVVATVALLLQLL